MRPGKVCGSDPSGKQSMETSYASLEGCRSASSTNQPEPISIEFPLSYSSNHPPAATTRATKKLAKQKVKPKVKKQAKEKANKASFDSPAMGTRSKKSHVALR